MKKWNKPLLAITAAIGLGTAGFAATALAAPPCYGYGPGYADEAQNCYQAPSAQKGDDRRAERWKEFLTKRHAELHDKLKLTANQESAWQTYTTATMKNMTPTRPWGQINFDSLSAPDRMEKALELMKERQSRMETQLAALKTFYATLTPEQQKIFDTETSPKKWRGKAQKYREMRQGTENN
ncbi:MAG: Spy/CpxP family protein refolding chaperone [Betaproteobacteria bacterium]|nr:Spy/CpxP family protein refolding chaperone [Betaproteobacteria bacterium]